MVQIEETAVTVQQSLPVNKSLPLAVAACKRC